MRFEKLLGINVITNPYPSTVLKVDQQPISHHNISTKHKSKCTDHREKVVLINKSTLLASIVINLQCKRPIRRT